MPADTAPDTPAILPLGIDGVLVRFALRTSPEASAAVQAFAAALASDPPDHAVEIAPSLASVLVRFDPARCARVDIQQQIAPLIASRDWMAAPPPPPSRRWTVPAAFGGDAGPQIAEAAALAGLSETRAVQELGRAELRVLAIGFAPGQPYLGLLPAHWNLARQPGLTPQVPAGALVVAVRQIVLFANPSTTGWRQVGRCGFRPFQMERAEPFALRPGDAVRFAPVAPGELETLASEPDGLGGARLEISG